MTGSSSPGSRAVSPVVGVVVLVALTVALAGVVAVAVSGVGLVEPAPTAGFDLAADADADEVTLTHRAGEDVDVAALTLRVTIGDDALDHQPPVPFFAARGFESGPTGPFNVRADATWSQGERATLALADTNAPAIDPGDEVVVTMHVDEGHLATVEGTAS